MRSVFALMVVSLAAAAGEAATSVKTAGAQSAAEVEVQSPSGKVALTVFVTPRGQLSYEVRFAGVPVVEASNLGIKVDGVDLGAGASLAKSETFKIDEKYPYRGVHSEAVNRCNGAKIAVVRGKDPAYTLEVRVFDDAAAFRFLVPGSGDRVPDAATQFRVPEGSRVWFHDLEGHYESLWDNKLAQDLASGEWLAPPVTYKLPGTLGYAAITEADLRDYAGMALQATGGRALRESLAHEHPTNYPFRLRYPEETVKRLQIPAAVTGDIRTPWRVVIVGADLNTLVNSDAIPNLCPPPDPQLFPQGIETPWLKTGRAVWRYLDGDIPLPRPSPVPADASDDVRRAARGAAGYAQVKEFSRLAGELGFEHQIIEGFWRAWTREQRRELVQYSKERGVGLWFWLHSRDLHDVEARRKLFAELHEDGVVGLKIDFFDHEAKEWVDLYRGVLRDAAVNQLLCDFHGANKPTGEVRTWPNEMVREAIRGMESSRTPAWGEHNTTWPFTRLLAGPADFTPTVFGDKRRETSWAHQIASAAVLTAPVLIYGGRPDTFLANPAADVIKSLPAVWDQTIVLPPSEIGDLALFARRNGDRWFIAATNNELVKDLKVETPFLEKGKKYKLTLVKDLVGVKEPADKVEVESRDFAGGDTLAVTVRGGGGFVARLVPQ